jgi:probable HAF family extracellular repeat protein
LHGYVYSGGANGTYTTLDDPSATRGTVALGINDNGAVVGYYAVSGSGGAEHGFIYSGGPSGTYTTIDDPVATDTFAEAVNNLGQVVGVYDLRNSNGITAVGSFPDSGGVYTTLDVPGSRATQAFGINDSGQIVGDYDSGRTHGFLLSGGTYTTLDDPNAGAGYTVAESINNAGQIVGYYVDSSNVAHGFLYSNGTWTNFDEPNARLTSGDGTYAFGINNTGEISGYYVDGTGYHAFTASTNLTAEVDNPVVSTVTPTSNEPADLAGATTTYQWEVLTGQDQTNPADWSNIAGAINATFTPDATLNGATIRLAATVTDADQHAATGYGNAMTVVDPTGDHWTNSNGGDWTTGGDWSLGTSPTASNNAYIDASGAYLLTITGADVAKSLTITAAGAGVDVQDETGGSLTLTGALTVDAGSFSLDGGSVTAAAIEVGANGHFIGGGTVSAPIDNNGGAGGGTGFVEARHGGAAASLALLGAATGSGLYQIDNGSTLEFGSSVAAGATIQFTDTAGLLKLDDAADFGAEIKGFTGTAPDAQHSDEVELVKTNFDAATLSDVAGYNSRKLSVCRRLYEQQHDQ